MPKCPHCGTDMKQAGITRLTIGQIDNIVKATSAEVTVIFCMHCDKVIGILE